MQYSQRGARRLGKGLALYLCGKFVNSQSWEIRRSFAKVSNRYAIGMLVRHKLVGQGNDSMERRYPTTGSDANNPGGLPGRFESVRGGGAFQQCGSKGRCSRQATGSIQARPGPPKSDY